MKIGFQKEEPETSLKTGLPVGRRDVKPEALQEAISRILNHPDIRISFLECSTEATDFNRWQFTVLPVPVGKAANILSLASLKNFFSASC